MQEEEFFNADGIVITRTLARFGGTSFAIANISMVRLYYVKKINPITVALSILGVIALSIAYNQSPFDDTRAIAIGVGALSIILAVVVQQIWPKKEYTFLLKANSGDAHSFTIQDAAFASKVKAAIESAIGLRL